MIYEVMIRDDFLLPPEERADLAYAPWGDRAEPVTRFQGCLVQNKGFLFHLTSWEKDPLVRFTEPGDPVYRDSCMELFCNFAPEKSDWYINFEMNANGAYFMSVGAGRYDRKMLDAAEMPTVKAERTDDFWSVTLFVPLACLREVYGFDIPLEKGHEMRANVYKCGADLKEPHWLCWNPVEDVKPNFHCPEQFGTFRLKA